MILAPVFFRAAEVTIKIAVGLDLGPSGRFGARGRPRGVRVGESRGFLTRSGGGELRAADNGDDEESKSGEGQRLHRRRGSTHVCS